ncbi:MAG TPA: hypothetical protein VKE69_13030 [Planctomycetota bacterium]|nr:hypothetical protein [Planctomycetota bacterium]
MTVSMTVRRRAEAASEPSGAANVALSFATVFAGWASGLAWYAASQGFEDLEAIRLWSGVFSFVAWLAAVIPLITYVDPERWMFRWPWAPVFGAVCGVGMLALLLLPFSHGEMLRNPLFPIHAAITGAVSWGGYSLACHWLDRKHAGAKSALALFATPPIVIVLFTVGAWPALERVAPSIAYRVSDTDTRARLYEKAIRGLRVGDSLSDLRSRLPGAFPVEPHNATGKLQSGAAYRLDVDKGRVKRIEIIEP